MTQDKTKGGNVDLMMPLQMSYLFLFYDTAFKDSKIIKGTYGLSTAHLIDS
jgi:hypothetical protein